LQAPDPPAKNATGVLLCPLLLKGVVATMSEPTKNPILDERVKPAMLNPVVTHVKASADLKWVLLCVGIALAVFLLALMVGKAP
jgi:hypothetical protein